MRSFTPGFLARQPLGPSLVQTIRLLGEYKGRQELFIRQSPQVLRTLRDAAVYASTESSNRIEGVVAAPERVRALVAGRSEPRNRSEQEIAGYRDVLNTIHVHHGGMELTSSLVLQLHRDLFQFAPGGGGRWKPADTQITETRADGTITVRFTPVSAQAVPDAMRTLHAEYAGALAAGEIEPLLLICAYVLDFLCIHPFRDGNGRMARLLTLLALYQAGYDVGRYVSLEALVEGSKESYYDALHTCSQGWHESAHTLVPWWEYMLGVVLLTAFREFERRVGTLTAKPGAKREMIVDAVSRMSGEFRYGDIERLLPAVSRPTINRVLRELRIQGVIRCSKAGRDATWAKLASGGGDQ